MATATRTQQQAAATLGVDVTADLAAVKAAHRRLVRLHHPDLGGDAASFRAVQDAFELLRRTAPVAPPAPGHAVVGGERVRIVNAHRRYATTGNVTTGRYVDVAA